MGAQRIILVEPETGMAAKLSRNLAKQSDVRVIAAAVAAEDGQGELSIQNLPELNSLAQPTSALQELYPGLRLRERQQVQLLSPGSFLKDVGGLGRPLLLILETPGSERATLEAWKAARVLDQIDLLELRCAEDVLYKGAAARAELEAWLLAEGFAVTARNTDDADWPVLQLRADHKARALTAAEARLAEQAQIITQREADLKNASERAAGLEATIAQLKETIAKGNATVAQREADLKSAADRTNTLEVTIAQLNETITKGNATITEREADLKSATDRAAALEATISQLKETVAKNGTIIAQREADLKGATDRAAALDATLAQLRKQTAQLNDDQQRSALDQRSVRRDLGLALRQQERLQADLRDLQERYEAVQAVRRDQDDLLRRLTPRLREAALHLQTLSLPDAGQDMSGPADGAQ
jgi:DNA repair exonuclease SbcCD ATPase subunit